jgi:hypothetical protein
MPADKKNMYGALGSMPEASESKAPAPPEESSGEMDGLSEEEKMAAEDMGFDATKAKALRRFIKACMSDESYEEATEPPAMPAPETGEM